MITLYKYLYMQIHCHIFVKSLAGITYTIDTKMDNSVRWVKKQLCWMTGTHSDQIRLVWAGRVLTDNLSLSECNLAFESTVHMIIQ